MLECGFAHGAFEHDDLVGQAQRVAVTEVDFHLRRAVLMDQRIEVQALQFAPVVDVLEQRVEFVGGIDGEALAAAFRAAERPTGASSGKSGSLLRLVR